MTRAEVLTNYLQRLPSTFLRDDTTFRQWQGSLATGLGRFTQASDAVSGQMSFPNAQGKWLDVWGLLFGLPRHDGEGDSDYRTRVAASLVTGNGPPLAIQNYMRLARNLNAPVDEAFPAVGWSMTLPGSVTPKALSSIAQDLDRVRPAGVPYDFKILRGGLFLSTVNYFGRASLTGAYLVTPVKTIQPPIGPSTNNAKPLLPTTFLTDPILNAG